MIPGTSTFAVTAGSKGDDGWIRADSRQFTLTVSGQLTASLSRDEAEVGRPVPGHARTQRRRGGKLVCRVGAERDRSRE
jgi:hypothetical protein